MISDPKPVDNSTDQGAEDQPSIPLYLAGLIVTLSGILAVVSYVDDQNLTVTTLLLTIIGFIFSIGCRYLRLHLHIAEILIVGTAAYVLYQLASGQLDWHMLIGHSQMDIGIVFAWAMTAWSWALISDSLILMSALLSMAAIGLVASVNLDPSVETCFIVFLISSLYLMGQHLYLSKRDMASRADRERTADKIWVTQLLVVVTSAFIVLLTASSLVVPAEMIFRHASLADALRGLAQLTPANKATTASGPNVSDDADLEIGTGQGWGATTDVVAYVEPSDKLPHYWKARTYDHYTGAGWTSSEDGEITDVAGRETAQGGTEFDVAGPSNYPNAQTISAAFDVRGNTHEFFYTGDLQQLTIDKPFYQLEMCVDGHSQLADHSAIHSTYRTVSTTEPDPQIGDWDERLRKCPTSYPPAITEMYGTGIGNQMTTGDDIAYFQNTVRSVFASLPPQSRNEFDEVQALTDYVAHRAVYTLDVAPLPAGSDHVRAFLQDTKAGYCDMFASSLAVLCRVAGFPSRVVTGFAPGDFDGTRYALRVMDKHAWTEVYFTGYGWVPFDATVGSAEATPTQTGKTAASTVWSRLRSFLVARGPVAPILMTAIILILGYIFKVEVLDGLLRRLRTTGGPVSREEIGRQYERMVRSIGQLGLRRKASETPFEFAERAKPYLRELETTLHSPLDTEAVTLFTQHYTVVRYGDERLRESVEAGGTPELSTFFKHARRARVKRVLRRLRRQVDAPRQAPAAKQE